MADTNRLILPLLSAAQAQKHVTMNEALKLIDAIVQAGVIDKDLTAPPGGESEGDIYIVGSSATGDWTTHDDDIAIYQDGGYTFITPLDGFIAFIADESTLYVYDSGWVSLAGILGANYLPLIGGTLTGNLVLEEATPSVRFNDTDLTGYTLLQTTGAVMQLAVDAEDDDASSSFDVTIDGAGQNFRVNEHGVGVGGASADATNGLSFLGTNVLFNSSGSIAQVFNKNAAGDDASFTFQQDFSTYALMGLLGDNDFTIKVGTGFTTAMVADESDGTINFPEGVRADTLHAYINTTGQTVTTSWATIANYDGTNIAASGDLSWNDVTGEAYVGKAGRFLISYSCTTSVSSGTNRSQTVVKLQEYNGTSWNDLPGAEHLIYNRQVGEVGTNASWTGVLDAASASYGYRLQVIRNSGTNTMAVTQVALNILRL